MVVSLVHNVQMSLWRSLIVFSAFLHDPCIQCGWVVGREWVWQLHNLHIKIRVTGQYLLLIPWEGQEQLIYSLNVWFIVFCSLKNVSLKSLLERYFYPALILNLKQQKNLHMTMWYNFSWCVYSLPVSAMTFMYLADSQTLVGCMYKDHRMLKKFQKTKIGHAVTYDIFYPFQINITITNKFPVLCH